MRLRRRDSTSQGESLPSAPAYGQDWDVPPRFNFVRDVVEQLAQDPARRALTFVDANGIVERLTFWDVAGRSAGWATMLREAGLDPGDRLLVLLGRRPEWHSVLLGSLKAGLVAVPCSDMLRAGDLAFRAEHSGARLIVSSPAQRAEVDAMLERLPEPLEVIEVEDEARLLRDLPTVAPTHDTAHDDPAFILYTSGTTREPKGVAHAHAYTFATRMQAECWLDSRPDDLVWCTAGTGWAKSIWNVLLGPWSTGAEIVMHESAFDPEERLELIERLRVTVLCQAPTEYRLMAKLDGLELYDLHRVRHAVSAGEPLNPEVIAVFRDVCGLTIHDGFGQTENSLLVANRPGVEIRPGSMGLPTPGHRVAVVDAEGTEVAPGVEGEIALYGSPPTLFLGYWHDEEATRACWRGDWYLTGDRAVADEDGYLWFRGRADDVILSAAYRIGPFEVESALLEHPAVAESAVVGKPDPDRGQIVKAFVVLRPGVEPSDELAADLQSHVKRVTAPYKYPREIAFVAQLPKTSSGKIRRVDLRAAEDAAAQVAGGPQRAVGVPGAPPTRHLSKRERRERAKKELLRRAKDEIRAQEEAQREARRRAEEDARRERASQEARARAEQEERARAEAEARAGAERAARARAEAEAERIAEAERLAEEQRLAEAERQAEAERIAEAERRAEEERQAEAERIAVAERRAEEERRAEAERIAEAERLVEAERIAEAQRLAEAERFAEAARSAENERQAVERARHEEAVRIARAQAEREAVTRDARARVEAELRRRAGEQARSDEAARLEARQAAEDRALLSAAKRATRETADVAEAEEEARRHAEADLRSRAHGSARAAEGAPQDVEARAAAEREARIRAAEAEVERRAEAARRAETERARAEQEAREEAEARERASREAEARAAAEREARAREAEARRRAEAEAETERRAEAERARAEAAARARVERERLIAETRAREAAERREEAERRAAERPTSDEGEPGKAAGIASTAMSTAAGVSTAGDLDEEDELAAADSGLLARLSAYGRRPDSRRGDSSSS